MQSSNFQTPPLSESNKWIIIIAAGLFVLSALLKLSGLPSYELLGLSADGLKNAKVFQLITFPFMTHGILGIIFESLIIWFLGSELENLWGKKFYLKFISFSVFFGSIVYLLISFTIYQSSSSVPFLGLAGISYSLCVAYGIIYSERYMSFMLIFPIKAKWFCLLMGAILLYGGLFSPFGKSAYGYIAVMIGSFLFLRYETKKKQGKKHSLSKIKKKSKANLYIVSGSEGEGDDKKPPTYH